MRARSALLPALVAAALVACGTTATPPPAPAPDAAPPPPPPAPEAAPPADASPPDAAPPCGRGGPRRCAVGAACEAPEDCESLNCAGGVCGPSSCTNKQQDGKETGVDCGGSCPLRCDGEPCTRNEECQSTTCKPDKTCAPPGTKTCGVGLPNPCENGDVCLQDRDCRSDYCRALSCTAPPATVHQDGRRNGGETGVDCGGTAAPERLCGAGERCVTSDDCISVCTAGGCGAPGPTDGKKNNGETDVDCGGPSAPKCPLTKACATNEDCLLAACAASVCVEPTASDGVRNGAETDVDCGGGTVTEGELSYTAPRCVDGRVCAAGADCRSGACSPARRCVPPSCSTAETAGIVTCGQGEVGNPAAVHDSCCKSLALPTRSTRRLDKYEITAGRMRTFIGAVGPNVRAWVTGYVGANPGSQLARLTTLSPAVTDLYPAARTGRLSVVAHLGAIDMDNYNGIRGCFNGYSLTDPTQGSSGHSTYWQPDADLALYGVPPRVNTRAVLDAKPLTCVTSMLLAAFCAWDGGELALQADLLDAWGPYAQPMGPTDPGRPAYNWCNGRLGTGGWSCQDPALGNQGIFYEFPLNTNTMRDLSVWIAAPGRFATDVSQLRSGGEGWYDLFGNLAEYTGDFVAGSSDFCDFSAAPGPGAITCTRSGKPVGSLGTHVTGLPTTTVVGRSWEGHNYGRGSGGTALMFQYGKFGGRCVRPAP